MTEITPKREQLPKLLIDADFFDKPKHIGYISNFGHEGLTYYFRLLFALARATDAQITQMEAIALASTVSVPEDRAVACLSYLLKRGMVESILIDDDLFITQTRLAEDQEKLSKSREVWREKKKRQRGDNSGESRGTLNTKDLTLNTKDLNLIKKEESGFYSQLPDPQNVLYLPIELEIPDPKPPKQKTKEPTDRTGEPRKAYGEFKHVWLSDAEKERWKAKVGVEKLRRMVEKLDATTEVNPTKDNIRKARDSACACFRSWVSAAIDEEASKIRRPMGFTPGSPPKRPPDINGFVSRPQNPIAPGHDRVAPVGAVATLVNGLVAKMGSN